MNDDVAGATEKVPATALSDSQLRTLLEWEPDFGGQNARPMLLAAATNRFSKGLVPKELVPA